MTYTMSILLILVNYFYALLKKHSKLFALLLLLFMWILFWANSKNPDYLSYAAYYQTIQFGAPIFEQGVAEFGYRLLMKLGVIIGLKYETFLAVITMCSYFIIYKTIVKYSNNINYIFLLYFIFPFLLDVVQIRNFIAMALFIYASKYLVEKTNMSRLKYVFVILLASTIHYSAILYLPMILISLRKKNIVRSIIIFSILFSIIIIINNKHIPYLDEIVRSFTDNTDNNKIINWFNSRTNWGFLLFWFMQTISFLMMLYSKTIISNVNSNINKYKNEGYETKEINISKYDKSIIFVEIVYWINVMAFIYFPFYILASTFTRLMRNILLLNYISFSVVNENIISRDKKLLYNTLVFAYVIIFFLFEIYMPYKEIVINAIMTNNSVFG